MLRAYYEQLLPYKYLKAYGDAEIIKKIDVMIDAYESAVKNHENLLENWAFTIIEQDDEGPEVFKKTMLTYYDEGVSKKLEIMSDFRLEDSKFRHTLENAEFKVIEYYEQRSKTIIGDADADILVVTRTNDINHPTIITKRGTIFKGIKEVKRAEKVTLPEQTQFE